MATLHLDNVNFVGTAADTKIAAHNGDTAAHRLGSPIADARRRLAKSPTVIVLGDSLCSGNNFYPNLTQNTKGWGSQTAMLSNGALKLRWNAGVPSNTTAQMVTRLAADVIARAPNICVILGGRNDVNTSVAVATSINNLDTIASTCLASSIVPVLCLVPPSSSGAISALTDLNAAIRLLCKIKGYLLCDTYTPFINGDGTQKTAYFEDSMHFNESGAKLAASTILAACGWVSTMGCTFAPYRGYAAGNLIANSDFSGAASGTPGTLPTGWYKLGKPVTQYSRDAEGINWCTLASADASNATIGVGLSSVVTGGAEVIIGARFENAVSAAALDVNTYLTFSDGTTYKDVRMLDGVVENANGIVAITSSAIAGNTLNSFNITVKPGKSVKFATPFVELL